MNQQPPSITPFMVEALQEYCRTYGFNPHVLVAVDHACQVPMEYVNNNQIVFDISDEAMGSFSIDENAMSFQARFGDDNHIETIYVPINRIAAAFPLEFPQMALQFMVADSTTDKAEEPQVQEAPRRPKRLK